MPLRRIPFPSGRHHPAADGQIAVTFPEGAVTGEPTLNIDGLSPSAMAKAPGGYNLGDSCFTLGVVDAEGNEIIHVLAAGDRHREVLG